MGGGSNQVTIDELAISQGGVFTSKQASFLNIPRYSLSYAASTGHIQRICHGAYRLGSSIDDGNDELRGIWMLTKPEVAAIDRLKTFDGIAICGSTAAAIHGIGDFFLTPYQIAVPQRFNSRKSGVKYVPKTILEEDVTWSKGLPVTKLERTLSDLLEMHEDESLVANALVDAIDMYGATTFNFDALTKLIGDDKITELLTAAGITGSRTLELIRLDALGHVSLKRKQSDDSL